MSDRADGKFNVLIIDDSAFQVKQISKMLEAQNFNVVGNASDGVEGLKLFQQLGDEIDLVTLDITMSGMDGISCLKEIMKINPKANEYVAENFISIIRNAEITEMEGVIDEHDYIVTIYDDVNVETTYALKEYEDYYVLCDAEYNLCYYISK